MHARFFQQESMASVTLNQLGVGYATRLASASHDHRPQPVSAPLRSPEPEGHVHGTIEVDGRHERVGQFPMPGCGIQRAEAVVAVRPEAVVGASARAWR